MSDSGGSGSVTFDGGDVSTQGILQVFNNLGKKVQDAGGELNDQINAALDANEVDPIEMLQLQFNMGRYNAMVEATSSCVKGLTDTAKTLAQRAGG